MSKRFSHHHPSGPDEPTAPGASSSPKAQDPPSMRDSRADIPGRACCCPAKPLVRAVMPASDAHPAVDLWLCGHHWRASRAALAQAGAAVYDVSPSADGAGSPRTDALV